jgi:acyl-CoA thioesterase
MKGSSGPVEAGNYAAGGAVFGAEDHAGNQLGKVDDYRGVMAFIIKAAKKKNIRFEVADFQDGEVICQNQDVAIFRGKALELLDRIFECEKSSFTGKVATEAPAKIEVREVAQ